MNMSSKTIQLTDALHKYMLSVSLAETDSLRRIREYTANLPDSNMQISPEQGQLMALLVKLINATKVVEIGTYTGYSALVFASAMTEGRVITIDSDAGISKVAADFWKEAGLEDRIEHILGEATNVLEDLISDAATNCSVDLVFIDADKKNYLSYYESAMKLLRPNGLILIDNVLWGGSVIDFENMHPDTMAIRELNQYLMTDKRVEISLVPIGDGLTIARKKTNGSEVS